MDNTPAPADPHDSSDELHEAAPVAGIGETEPVEIVEGDPDAVGEPPAEWGTDENPDADAERADGATIVVDETNDGAA